MDAGEDDALRSAAESAPSAPHEEVVTDADATEADAMAGVIESLPGVDEAVVLDLAGETGGRVVVIAAGDAVDVTAESVNRALRSAFGEHAVVARVYVTGTALPRSGDGSVDLAALERRVREATPAPKRPGWLAAAGVAALVGLVGFGIGYNAAPDAVSTPLTGTDSTQVRPSVPTTISTAAPPAGPATNPPESATPAVPTQVLFSDSFGTGTLDPIGEPDVGLKWSSPDYYEFEGVAFVGPSSVVGDTALALNTVGRDSYRLEVELVSVQAGSGAIVRFKDVRNFFYVDAAPGVATWNVVAVIDGVHTVIGNTGLSAIDNGARLSIEVRPNGLTVQVNDAPPVEFDDARLADGGSFGLIASGPRMNDARFDNLRVLSLPDEVA